MTMKLAQPQSKLGGFQVHRLWWGGGGSVGTLVTPKRDYSY